MRHRTWIFTVDRWLLILFLVFLLALVVALFLGLSSARAASGDAPPCEAINTAGAITVYRCEPNSGGSYLLNSVGFMAVEQ
jgi:hypothetical protein